MYLDFDLFLSFLTFKLPEIRAYFIFHNFHNFIDSFIIY